MSNTIEAYILTIYNKERDPVVEPYAESFTELPNSLQDYTHNVSCACASLGSEIQSRQIAALMYINWETFLRDK